MLFIATRSRATTLRIRFIFDCYRLPCLIVSSLSAFKGGRKEEGRKEEWRRRRSSPLSPFSRYAESWSGVLRRLVSCSCREIADHGRGVKSRLSSNLLSFHANFSRCSLRSAIHVPPSFFLCARRFLSSPQLSRIGYKRRHLILNKGNDFICFSHLLQRSFFLFLPRKIYRVINHVDIHISCSFVHFFNFYVYRSSMHFFSICHLYVMYRSDSQQF